MRQRVVVKLVVTALLVALALAGPPAPGRGAPRAEAAPAPVEALLVGDSVMNGMAQGYGAPARALLAARHSFILDSAGCRRLITTSCSIGGNPAPTNAITVVKARAGQYDRTLVVAVGYNDPPSGPVGVGAAVDAIVAAAHASGIHDIVWLTYREAGSAGDVARFTASNAVLWAKAAEIPDLRIADWATRSAGLPASWFSTDGIHLGGSAALAMAELVADALDGAPPTRCLPEQQIGDVPPDPGAAPPATGGPSGGIHLLPTPVRLLDTRSGSGALGDGRVAVVPVADALGGETASAAVISLTRVDACADGFLTAYPCGETPPNASVVNGPARATVANAAVVSLGAGGTLCVFASGATDVIVDVTGFVGPSGDLTAPLPPRRLVDTRPGAPQALDVVQQPVGPAGLTVDVAPAFAPELPPAAVTVNLTAAGPTADGFLSLLPGACTGATPATSSLNVAAGRDAAATSPVGLIDGRFCVVASAPTDVILDLQAAHDAPGSTAADGGGGDGGDGGAAVEGDAQLTPVTPSRLYDSRTVGPLEPGEQRVLPQLIPADRAGAVVNVTLADPAGAGYVSVQPCGAPPGVSNVNTAGDGAVANLSIVPAGDDGDVCVAASVRTDVVLDVEAWIA